MDCVYTTPIAPWELRPCLHTDRDYSSVSSDPSLREDSKCEQAELDKQSTSSSTWEKSE
jgi:hypothetical protein